MGIWFSELIVILVIILILFGQGKLTEIGKAIGRGVPWDAYCKRQTGY
ncbi:MAG: twin-arginine translocase TatA/TatE family subunit [Candidatus Ozemobacteraceae bacterium]